MGDGVTGRKHAMVSAKLCSVRGTGSSFTSRGGSYLWLKVPGILKQPDVVGRQTCIALDAFLQQQRLEARSVRQPLSLDRAPCR